MGVGLVSVPLSGLLFLNLFFDGLGIITVGFRPLIGVIISKPNIESRILAIEGVSVPLSGLLFLNDSRQNLD